MCGGGGGGRVSETPEPTLDPPLKDHLKLAADGISKFCCLKRNQVFLDISGK